MTALLKLDIQHEATPATLPEGARGLLNKLRFHASQCRASAYLDIFSACSVLDPNADRAEDAQMRVLLRVMGQALEKEPVFHRPGEPTLSFDESWLMTALTARAEGDDDSFTFLLHRRVSKEKRRIFSLLLGGLSEFLTERA